MGSFTVVASIKWMHSPASLQCLPWAFVLCPGFLLCQCSFWTAEMYLGALVGSSLQMDALIAPHCRC